MKIDPSITFVTLDGDTLRKTETPDSAPVTLGWIIANALINSPVEEKDKAGADKKFERFMLGMSFAKATAPVEVEVEQLADIRKCVNDGYTTLIVGQAWPHLKG